MGLAYQSIADAMNQRFGAVAPTAVATHEFALMAQLPSIGGGGVEASGGSYARVSKTNNTTTYPSAAVGAVSKYAGVAISFTCPAGTWAGVAVYAVTTGVLQGFAPFLDSEGEETTITTALDDIITLPANSGFLIEYVDPDDE